MARSRSTSRGVRWPTRRFSRVPLLRAESLEPRMLLAASSLEEIISGPLGSTVGSTGLIVAAAPAPTSASLGIQGGQSTDDDSSGGPACPVCGSVGCVAHRDAAGNTFYALSAIPEADFAGAAGDPGAAGPSPAPLADTFKLHSRPSATKVIYLDFDGHTTSGTAWNNGATIVTPAYSPDGVAGFSNTELSNIQNIWARVVEDFSPFDVDVTTEEPALEDLRKLGTNDTRWGIRVVIGIDSGSVAPSAGGVAYLTSFNWNSDTPCFVFPERLANYDNKCIAEATSHEVGHTLGLSHDGRLSPSEGYYGGHGTGATGWAPIMGVGYSKALVQWSKGEYASANNKEDDLKIITTDNGFGYRADDYGNTTTTAFVPSGLGLTPTIVAGVVEQSTDVDVFRFSTLNTIKATILPDSISANLDVAAEIWDSAGQVIFTSNPTSTLDASFDVTVSPGEYYLAIRGAGLGDPLGTGYTSYASLGQYSLSLAVNPDTGTTVAIAAADASKAEGDSGTTPFTFTVTRAGTTTGTTSVNWAVAGSGTNPASATDFVGGTLPSGLLSFGAGETTKTITVNVAGDLAIETDETFTVTLSSATGGSIATASAGGTIVNDDTEPSLAIAATGAVKAEGNSGSTPFTFTVTRTGSTLGATSANWAVTGGNPNPATGPDFVGGSLPSGTVSFAAGETTKTITVNVAGDPDVESDELFTVTLSGVSGGVIGTASADGAILNDDAVIEPSLAITAVSASKAEGNSGATSFTFRITRSGSTTATTAVNWTVAGSGVNPAAATDFVGGFMPSGSVTFAAGETVKDVSIDVAGDLVVEADEGFTVSLWGVSGGTISTGTASGTIVNDDVNPNLSIAATSANKVEGNSGTTPFTFTVTRSGSTLGTTSVTWSVAGAGADPASADDFQDGVMPSGTLVFADGEASKVITVNVIGDLSVEADEGFVVTLSDVVGGLLGTTSASGTIRNDDVNASVSVTATNATRMEGNSGTTAFTFTVTRSLSTAGVTTAAWIVRGTGDAPAEGNDFSGGMFPGGMLTFNVGETTKTVTVNVSGDLDPESNEGFVLQLTDVAGGTVATGSANGLIINDDTGLSIAGAQSSRLEGNTGGSPASAFSFTVTRSGIVSGSTSVRWTVTGSGSAAASASDFVGGVLPSGSVSFAPGESSKTITVNVNGDSTPESNEGFTVTLAEALGGKIVRSSAAGTILDDDLVLSVSTSTPSQVEGNSGLVPYVFTVTRPASAAALVVNWKTEGSGALPAKAADFDGGVLPTGSLSFAGGETTKTITVNVAGDSTYEFDERFAIVLFGDLIRTTSGSASIVNDDTSLDISRASAVRAEGNSGPTPFTFTVTRAGVTSGTASVSWAVTGTGTNPAADTDFTDGSLPSGSVSFAAGERTKTITVNVAGDSTLEWDEEFTVTLSSPSGGSIGTGTATGRIVNDESAVRIDAVTPSLKEGNAGTTTFGFTVTRLNAAAGVASLSWAVSGTGSAPADADDFSGGSLPAGTVTFGVGEASKTIFVKVNGDTTLEADEGFTVTLSNAVGCEIQTATASATIVSDDAAVAFDVSSASVTLAEGNSGTTPFNFTVTRSGAVSDPTTVRWSVFGTGQAAANAADFAASSMPSGLLNFAPGETSKVISLPVVGDLAVERDETFVVLLSEASNARILSANAKANGTILTDDTGLSLSPASIAVTEGNSGVTAATFTVTRSGFTDTSTTFDWTVSGTSNFPADAADFDGGSLPSGSVTFAAGETTKTITVNVAGDTLAEAEERFALAITSTSAVVQAATAMGVIRNDDASFSISPTTLARSEGNSGTSQFVFTVTRTGLTTDQSTVNWSVAGSGGSPATATDFAGGTLPSGTLTFNPGQTTARITVGVVGDRVAEADEGFTVTLTSATIGQILAGSATATILNDDAPPPARPFAASSKPVAANAKSAAVTAPAPSQAATPRAAAFAQLAQTASTSPYSRVRRGFRRG